MPIGSYANSPAPGGSGSRIDEAVRALITSIDCHRDVASRPDRLSEPEEVILDTQIEGFRCVLIRMNASPISQVRLSPREREIVRMVANGHPNKVIADILSISSWTVCTHLRRIFAKLGVATRAAMVARLMEPNPFDKKKLRAAEPQPHSSECLAVASRRPAHATS